ncbi:hypothetical protein VB773_01865 [Haloarculaceae archaeon H-GB2-1]|nr:hypothetical protein [Haloarculaceae archaeon H-GB11]MEA5406449.1 hypothetical protein [Haloarculaceae archaeon H-GB2-1]
MRLRIDGRLRTGDAIAVTDVSAAAVAAAIRGDHERVHVAAPEPGPLFEHVGVITESTALRVRTAVARAARTRGLTTELDAERAAVRRRLDELECGESDPKAARRRVAEAGADEQRLRERVAELRGKLQAVRDAGATSRRSKPPSARRFASCPKSRPSASPRSRRSKPRRRELETSERAGRSASNSKTVPRTSPEKHGHGSSTGFARSSPRPWRPCRARTHPRTRTRLHR